MGEDFITSGADGGIFSFVVAGGFSSSVSGVHPSGACTCSPITWSTRYAMTAVVMNKQAGMPKARGLSPGGAFIIALGSSTRNAKPKSSPEAAHRTSGCTREGIRLAHSRRMDPHASGASATMLATIKTDHFGRSTALCCAPAPSGD